MNFEDVNDNPEEKADQEIIKAEDSKEPVPTIGEISMIEKEQLKEMHWNVDGQLGRIVGDIIELTNKIARNEVALYRQEQFVFNGREKVNQAMSEALSLTDNEQVKTALLSLREKLYEEREVFRKELNNANEVNTSTGWFRGKEKREISNKLNVISQGFDDVVRFKEKLPELQAAVDAEKIYIKVGESPEGEILHLMRMAKEVKEKVHKAYQPVLKMVEKLPPEEQTKFSVSYFMREFEQTYDNFVAKADEDLQKREKELRQQNKLSPFEARKSNNFRKIAQHILFEMYKKS